MDTNPQTYGLSLRIELQKIEDNHIAIVKLIKSRIIQKDAKKILEIAKRLQHVKPSIKVSLICTPNICSKSLSLLKREGIACILIED